MTRLFVCLVLGACGASTPATANSRNTADEGRAREVTDGAGGAAESDDPEIARLVVTLDEDADELHLDMTPSVHALSEMGVEGARAVLSLLDAEEELTRLHAQRVVEGVVSRSFGFRPGSGFPSPEMDEAAGRAVREWGYAYDAPRAERQAAVERIAASLDSMVEESTAH